jgi:DNA invertase Pin-like site-specific DNA recombinase
MARYSGGPVTHAALTGPKPRPADVSDEWWKQSLTGTLRCVREIRQKCDATELRTVKLAREAGMSWTEIATALGVTRQSAWERWHELDEAGAGGVSTPSK